MADALYRLCDLCHGEGWMPPHGPSLEPCGCQERRVRPAHCSMEDVEALKRELSRRDLRIRGLTEEAAAASREVLALRGRFYEGISKLSDCLDWLAGASRNDVAVVYRHAHTLLAFTAPGAAPVILDMVDRETGGEG